MAKENGNLEAIFMMGNGSSINLKEMEKFTPEHQIIKGRSRMGISMEEEFKYLRMVINMKDFMQMENLKEMELICGIMELFIKGSLKMELGMDMENGVMENKSIKENILTIKEMDKEFISGMEEVITKDNFLMI